MDFVLIIYFSGKHNSFVTELEFDHWDKCVKTAQAFYNHSTDKYDTVRIGINSRLDTLQAAVGRDAASGEGEDSHAGA